MGKIYSCPLKCFIVKWVYMATRNKNLKSPTDNVINESDFPDEIGKEYTRAQKKSGKNYERDNASLSGSNEKGDDYYNLKTDAIDLLVNTKERMERGEINQTNADMYKGSMFSKVPYWLKALFIKFWFNGAVCFFIIWGLGLFVTDMLDMTLVCGIVMGLVADLLVSPSLRFVGDAYQYKFWMLMPMKKFWTLFVNLVYAVVLMFVVAYVYEVFNAWLILAFGFEPNSVPLGIEPISFGLIYLACDLAVIGLKDLIVFWVRKIGRSKNVADN